MRLIDADAIIKEIKARNPDDVSYEDAWAITCIEHAPTIKPGPRWIPCEESLPQSGTACFVTTECGGERNTCISVFDCGTGWSNLEYGERVISWIKLPEPWGGERDGSD